MGAGMSDNVVKSELSFKNSGAKAPLPVKGISKKKKKAAEAAKNASILEKQDESEGKRQDLMPEATDYRTPAQKRHDEEMAKRDPRKIMSYQKKKQKFNEKLLALTEHHDVPKVAS